MKNVQEIDFVGGICGKIIIPIRRNSKMILDMNLEINLIQR